MLYDHRYPQPCTNSSFVCWLFHGPLPASLQEEKQGLQKDVPSDGSST
ncbi:unnamed protein product [Gulo gulo]|uniref:Uncharacterized protein n=1 Tax=Gulo gulo TaxID=48420 RepID=A0A9X9Q4D7_GULGU|nr:unnamed protein product [Gulo gulo]